MAAKCLLIVFFGTLLCQRSNAQSSTAADSILLYTQRLLDAITTGDTSAWNRYLDDSCVITPENGRVESKQVFIRQLKKPPYPYVMTEVIRHPLFKLFPGTVIFSYVANTTLGVGDQQWQNDISQTDTWLHTMTGWKLIATAAFIEPANPAVHLPDSGIVKKIVGEYRLSDAYTCSIYEKEGKLYSKRTGRDQVELEGETDYVFMTSNPFIKLVFVHDQQGNVIQLRYRRAGVDLVFTRIK